MKLLLTALAASIISVTTLNVDAAPAKSEKHAKGVLKMRKAVFSLLGSNMGPMGAMAKGKIPMDAQVVEKNATRINQLSLMIADYMATDTSTFKLDTDALAKIWTEQDKFAEKTQALTDASQALIKVAQSGDEDAIKKAIRGVGASCGGCHDDFKAD